MEEITNSDLLTTDPTLPFGNDFVERERLCRTGDVRGLANATLTSVVHGEPLRPSGFPAAFASVGEIPKTTLTEQLTTDLLYRRD